MALLREENPMTRERGRTARLGAAVMVLLAAGVAMSVLDSIVATTVAETQNAPTAFSHEDTKKRRLQKQSIRTRSARQHAPDRVFVSSGRHAGRRPFVGVAAAYHSVSYAGILTGMEPRFRPELADGLQQFFGLLDAAVPAA